MTGEQRSAFETFRSVVSPLRLRVKADVEGFPIAPGRYGQLEWHDAGQVAIYSQTMRMLAKLLRIPGVHRHQVGDHEFRLLLPVDNMHDRAGLGAIAKLLRISGPGRCYPHAKNWCCSTDAARSGRRRRRVLMQNDEGYADRVVREAMLAASGGLDPDKVAEVVAKVVDAVHKQAEALKQADYRPGDYERIARAMAHAMKSADGLYRLVEFAAGRPDSLAR